jgi:diaminopimelate epimerase
MNPWPDAPRLSAAFYKAHGLGNDYLVFEEGRDWHASPLAVRRVCDPHVGVGSDGIVAVLADRSDGVFRLRMFNPDGSEFERSGNGLRVLASYLARGEDAWPSYLVEVGGERVTLRVHDGRGPAYDISVEMGRARIGAEAVGLAAGALDAQGRLSGPGREALHVVPVSVGNPHLVTLVDRPTEERLGELGPFLARHPALAHGANVQLAAPLDDTTCRALVWERGVGPTSASGTSACAVAVAMVHEGLVRAGPVTVEMPGGSLLVTVSPELDVVLRAPVEEVCTGTLTPRFLLALGSDALQ